MTQAVSAKKTLLVCTVGGSPEPIINSIKHWRPARILFVASKESEKDIAGIVELAQDGSDAHEAPDELETLVLRDAQNTESCVDEMRAIAAKINQWAQLTGPGAVVVDFTGGTKCMSAALAMATMRTECIYSYVGSRGGTQGRDRGGLGAVKTGSEQIVNQYNPYKSRGYEAYEQAASLFNGRLYGAAAERMGRFSASLPNEAGLTAMFNALTRLMQGYANWDCFEHAEARKHLSDAKARASVLPGEIRKAVEEKLGGNLAFLQEINDTTRRMRSVSFVCDLWVNARHLADVGRYDDATARLYRAMEAFAQLKLAEHGINSAEVTLKQLPESLKYWQPRFKNKKHVLLSLKDDYALLQALDDAAGKQFYRLHLDDHHSSLRVRNHSILAHGYVPVRKRDFDKLEKSLGELTGLQLDPRCEFPQLPAQLL